MVFASDMSAVGNPIQVLLMCDSPFLEKSGLHESYFMKLPRANLIAHARFSLHISKIHKGHISYHFSPCK